MNLRLNGSPYVRDRQALLVVRYGLGWHTALHAARLLHAHPTLRVTSGRRTVARNRSVGGSPTSYHLRGRAVDFAAPLDVLRRAEETARRQRVSPGCTGPEEVILERAGQPGQHLHVAW